MPVNFNNFTASAAIQETDQVVGFANTYSGGERRWTFGTLRATLVSGAASTIATSNLPASKILASDTNGKVTASSMSTTQVQQGLTPVGAVMAFAMQTAPEGWLECDGSAVSRTTYSNLLQVIGTIYGVGNNTTTFNLPDLRGEFIRGWDDGRGVDTDRTFGTRQKGTITIVDPSNTSNNVAGIYSQSDNTSTSFAPIAGYDIINIADYTGVFRSSITGVGSGALDTNGFGQGATRPRNVALLYCIKF